MPKANLMNAPQHKASLSYSGFDLGQLEKFSSSVGQLIPIWYDIASPGDKYYMSTEMKTRTQPLNSAAFTSLKEHVEWFFVPIEYIWKPFGNFFFGINDFSSNFYSNTTQLNYFPFLTYGDFCTQLDVLLNTVNPGLDDCGYNSLYGTLKLAECFGIPIHEYINGNLDLTKGYFSFTPLFMCAYQKIWYDHYRPDNWFDNRPEYYNLDNYVDNTYNVTPRDVVQKMCRLRYRPFQKDFFTDVLPSPLLGSSSIGALSNSQNILGQVNQWLSGLTGVRTAVPVNSVLFPDGGYAGSTVNSPTTVKIDGGTATSATANSQLQYALSGMNPANLRSLFASEKLIEITRRAGKHYDKQTLAHFGVNVENKADGEAIFIGSDESDIVIGDVVSTTDNYDSSTGTGAPLGEISGKGYGVNFKNGKKEFTADRHGVIMAIYSCEPYLDYDQTGVDKLNCLINSVDFYKPEYADLGMQPLFGRQTGLDPLDAQNNTIYGWQYRYSEFKRKYDRVFGNLMRSMSFWTTARKSMNISPANNVLIRPNYLDAIMVDPLDMMAQRQPTPAELKEFDDTDPLIHEFYVDVKKASKMSTYGLPSL